MYVIRTELTENVNNTCQSYAVLNKNVFNSFFENGQGACRCDRGRQTVPLCSCCFGPTTAKDRSPAAVFDRGTNRRPELVERRCRLAVADDGGRM